MQEITQKPILFWWTAVQVRNSQLEHCRQLRLFFCYMAEKWSVSVTNKAIAGGPRRVFECPLPECSFIAMSTMALKVPLQILLNDSTVSTLMCHIIEDEDIRYEHYQLVSDHFYLFENFFLSKLVTGAHWCKAREEGERKHSWLNFTHGTNSGY